VSKAREPRDYTPAVGVSDTPARSADEVLKVRVELRQTRKADEIAASVNLDCLRKCTDSLEEV